LMVPKLERQIGIEVYATRSLGIGGTIRRSVDDFVVEEALVDGSKAEVGKPAKLGALGSSMVRNRYLLCVLVKRDWDTLSAVNAVADQLGISMGRIQTGGLKDAKAVTAQHITVENVSAEDAAKVKIKDIELHPIGYFREELSSYYLLGNSFHITISEISHPKSTAEKRMTRTIEELRSAGGVPNFFGHQRFGTTRPITHLVGKAMIKGDVRKAAMLFLAKPSHHEHPQSRQAREELQASQDFAHALKHFPKQLRYERLMLEHLAKEPSDYTGAFRCLPLKLQQLFIQAYQSHLFNKFLSRRIAAGLRLYAAEVGDNVVGVERSGMPLVSMVKSIRAENIAEVNKALDDEKMRLALPLFGYRQRLSLGMQGQIEKQILEEEGVTAEDFRVRMLPQLALKGSLRAVIVPLNDLSVDRVSHDSMNLSKWTVGVSFALYRGSYATIVLRELMKPRSLIRAGF